jgi:hypothetical protein
VRARIIRAPLRARTALARVPRAPCDASRPIVVIIVAIARAKRGVDECGVEDDRRRRR